MTDHEIVCPKCGAAMREGFVPDHAQGGYVQTTWYEGPVEKSFWAGLKVSGKSHFQVRSYRCSKCGYLESYAT